MAFRSSSDLPLRMMSAAGAGVAGFVNGALIGGELWFDVTGAAAAGLGLEPPPNRFFQKLMFIPFPVRDCYCDYFHSVTPLDSSQRNQTKEFHENHSQLKRRKRRRGQGANRR